MSSRKLVVSLQNASFRVGEELVFRETTWAMHQGECWGVLGANGSGKSLFADALRGKLPLASGELRYHFKGSRGVAPEDSIGHVSFEDRGLDASQTAVQCRWNSLEEEASLSVREFLSYDRAMDVNPYEVTPVHDLLRPAFEKRVQRAIALLQVETLLGRMLLSLSNGETQRVRLARALARGPRLLVLDDPFTGLDAETRRRLHDVLRGIVGSGIPLIIIAPRENDLPTFVTHVLHVRGCQIQHAGRRPRSGAVQRKLNTPPSRATTEPASDRLLISMRDVRVQYGDKGIIDGLDWAVREGEHWAVLGPNGSGKTTLLSLMTGDHPQAYSNAVSVLGRSPGDGTSVWELKRRIGIVSPEIHAHFDLNLTATEAVASGFYDTVGVFCRPGKALVKRARDWLQKLRLAAMSDTPLFSLSTGHQRVVLLARALVKSPELLLLDEPCQGLDDEHRELFVSLVDELAATGGLTVIYITHRAEELPRCITKELRLPYRRGTAR